MTLQNLRLIRVWAVMAGIAMSGCTANNPQVTDQSPKTSVNSEIEYVNLNVGNVGIIVEVADTPEKITLGLGYRDELGSEGMLFVMPTPYVPSFWMKGMRFGLDFVWIGKCDETGLVCEVVEITEKVPAPNDPEDWENLPHYSPDEPVKYVLEVKSGWIEELSVEVGEKVVIEN